MEVVGVTYNVVHKAGADVKYVQVLCVEGVKMSKLNIKKIYKKTAQIGGAHLQYVRNQFARFE